MEVKTMEPKKLLEKYYSRLAQESFLKSLLWGLVVGFPHFCCRRLFAGM